MMSTPNMENTQTGFLTQSKVTDSKFVDITCGQRNLNHESILQASITSFRTSFQMMRRWTGGQTRETS